MKSIFISAIFVGANFFASFLIIVIIVRASSEDHRVGFFVFQSLYFPLTTMMSQTKMMLHYRGVTNRNASVLIDLFSFVVSATFLQILVGDTFSISQILLLSLSIPLTYHGSNNLLRIQFDAGIGKNTFIPISTAAVRIFICFIGSKVDPVISFSLSAVAFAAVPAAIIFFSGSDKVDSSQQTARASSRAALTVFFYFCVASFSFQVDRLIIASEVHQFQIVMSGICSLWVVSPISVIFATFFRADASVAQSHESRQLPFVLTAAAKFTAASIAYVLLMCGLWLPVNSQLFPFASIHLYLPLLLSLAVYLDRIGQLILLLKGQNRDYALASVTKLISLSLCVFAFEFELLTFDLTTMFLAYCLISLVFCASTFGMLKK